jgi:hypothetical protein
MKSLLTKLAAGAFALAALSLSSCKKDEVQATVSTTAPTLTASTNSVVLLQANSTQTAVTFTWTPIAFNWTNAEHAYNPPVTYTFELDKKGNSFAKPTTFSAGSTPPTTFTVGALNDLLTSAGYVPGTAADLEIRLAAKYANNVSTLYSSTVALKATPYLFICNAPAGSASWSIIGPAGVDWNTDVPLKYNCNTNTFDVTRALNAGDFKFRANNDWTLNYGSNSSAGGPLVNGGNNITVATAGTYTIKLDLNNMVYSIQK